MSDAPLELTDDDFTSEAPPPGYLSRKLKDRYLPLMITLAFVIFVAQFAVPAFFMMTTMQAAANPARQGMQQYAKFAAWQEALWYPTISMFGGGQGRSRLVAIDFDGKPLDRLPISLDMEPEWLIGDGDTLWAVSPNEVAEIFADGSAPIVMRPERYLLNPSRPFLHDGQLMVFDRDEDEPFHWYVFTNGEWTDQGEVWLPAESLSLDAGRANGESAADPNAPADALLLDNEQPELPEPPISSDPFATAEPTLQLAAVSTPAGLAVFALHDFKVYYRLGVPLKTADALVAKWSDWEQVKGPWGTEIRATVVWGQPTVIASGENKGDWNVWRKLETGWLNLKSSDSSSRENYLSDLGIATLPDGGRTLMLCEEYGGYGSPLLELKPDGITQVASLGSPFGANNPFADFKQFQNWPMSIAMYSVVILQVLLITWLMRTHRDPYYYKGTAKVAYASVLRRVLAALIDTAIVYGPVALALMYWLPDLNDPTELIKRLETDPRQFLAEIAPTVGTGAAWVLGWAFVMWLTLSFWGCTPGKFVCSVRVATANLDRPGLFRGLVRSIILPFESFLFNGLGAFILIAFTPNWQRLADLVGGMVVVKAGSLRQARQAASP